MITEEDVKSLIVLRIIAASESCNSHHINHVDGQIRALVTVISGEVPPASSRNATVYLDAAGIPYTDHKDGTFEWEDQWLKDHGFNIEYGETAAQDVISHPKFGSW